MKTVFLILYAPPGRTKSWVTENISTALKSESVFGVPVKIANIVRKDERNKVFTETKNFKRGAKLLPEGEPDYDT